MRKRTSWPYYLLPLVIVVLYGVWLLVYDHYNPRVHEVMLSPAKDIPVLFENNWQLHSYAGDADTIAVAFYQR